jgi:Trk K+ transport system NAD-binding subunit
VAFGSLLLGTRFSIDTDSDGSVDVTTVRFGAGSPAVGRTVSEIPMPPGSEAVVLAVVRDDTPQLLEDMDERRCQPGDRLVVAARPEHVEGLRARDVQAKLRWA